MLPNGSGRKLSKILQFFSVSLLFLVFFPLCCGAWHRERFFSGLLGRPPSPRVFAHAEPQGDNFFMFTAFSFIIFICCWVGFFWWSFFCCLDVVACVFVLTSVQVPFPACPGGIDVLTTTSYFPACPGDMEIVSGDGPLPMAIFELLEYIVNEVMGRTPWWLVARCTATFFFYRYSFRFFFAVQQLFCVLFLHSHVFVLCCVYWQQSFDCVFWCVFFLRVILRVSHLIVCCLTLICFNFFLPCLLCVLVRVCNFVFCMSGFFVC